MAKPRSKDLPDLCDLAQPGARITVRVTPKAAATRLSRTGEDLRIAVTAAPENGKANAAVQAVLAKAMGAAPSHLTLLRGQTGRTKVFVYSGPETSRS
ncbi:DUF167 domain-containing protein [Sedimentitalea nanhaiensis]|uniref:UPF0235 protein SAMN05216236_1487 n=1 Tax=Sedimentitalea nanhaiensis TaxID=999627 RepID=A0A1I7E7D7_9RHOB|nr:DUF167 domain-containing protein [Sedimentitalea nanhaiensis]SFU19850.1 hypothetical protein SAMN05216236_1487 [Sedimentitalea nanhaiensis]